MTSSTARTKVWLSWSTGKDSAWALHVLQQRKDIEVTGLITSLNRSASRVAMHAVRDQLLDLQACAVGLPVHKVWLPHPCSNDDYEAAMQDAWSAAKRAGVQHVAFGDLFLQDVRAYRERQLEQTGLTPLFPLWNTPTDTLAAQMVRAGVRAWITAVDPAQLDASFVGRRWEQAIADYPDSVDHCGENGESHTFVVDGPMFAHEVPVTVGERVHRGGFWFADMLSA